MHIEILTIGNEILSGKTRDSNFQFLANEFSSLGFPIRRHITVTDNSEEMKNVFMEAFNRSHIVLTTGGLGPTLDDKTKEVVTGLFKTTLVKDEAIEKDLKKRYGEGLTSLHEQSMVPKDCTLLRNEVGTATGYYFHQHDKHFFVLPGVPLEMKTMFANQVMPYLLKIWHDKPKQYSAALYLCHLSENMLDPVLRDLERLYPDVEMGIYPAYGFLSVEFKIKEKNHQKALKTLEACQKHVENNFSSYRYSTEDKRIEKAIHDFFIKNNYTLALAESITGGHIAAKLTEIPGASKYFLAGIVSYSNEAKKKILHVKKNDLQQFGAVSKNVVRQMAEGALEASGAMYAIAVSGIAGPDGGSEEKPIGTVWCAISKKNSHTVVWKIQAKGRAKRASVIEYTSNYILGALWRLVFYGEDPSNHE